MFERISFRLFGNMTRPYLKYFEPLKDELLRAGVKLSLHEYLVKMIFLSIIAFVAPMLILSLLFGFMLTSVALIVSFTLIISFGLGIGMFLFYYYRPSMIANSKKRKIENVLPFATSYMATIASSGSSPVNIFKVLSGFEEYGELSRESQKIYTDVDMFGVDLNTAIKGAANRTPSPNFKDLLWGFLSILNTGGDLSAYLREKSKGFMNEYRRALASYSQQLSLYIEIYITLVIVGSLFFLILSAIMAALTPTTFIIVIQFFLIFVLLPGISIGFIIILKGLSPTGK